jgi:hypothetical protein
LGVLGETLLGETSLGEMTAYQLNPAMFSNRYLGEPLWLSGKVVKNKKINEIERTRVRSPHRATSLKKVLKSIKISNKYVLK